MFDTMSWKMGNARFAVTTDERPGATYFAPTADEAWQVAFRLVDQGIALEGIAVIDRMPATHKITCYTTDGRQCMPTTSTIVGTLDEAKAFVDAAIADAKAPFTAWEERFGAWNREGAAYGWQVE